MLFCLLVIVFSLHLVSMNLASAGLLVASSVECSGKHLGPRATSFAALLAGYSTLGLLLGAVLGGVMLLFFWTDSYQDLLLRRLQSRSYFGLLEVAFSLLLHTIYWRWAAYQRNSTAPRRKLRAILAILSSANLLYHFPTLFAIVAQIATESTVANAPIGRMEFYSFLRSGPILSHAAHFLLASIAASGVLGAFLAQKISTDSNDSFSRRLCTCLALVSTVLQIPVGIAVYLTLPGGAQRGLLGDNTLLSVTFLASLASALWLMQSLLGQLPVDAPKTRPFWSAIALLVTIFLMSGVLWGTRVDRFGPKPVVSASK